MNFQPSAKTLEAAATWYVDLQGAEDDDPVHQAHRQWLSEHPAHRQAWGRVEKLQQMMASTPDSVSRSTLIGARASRRKAIKALSLLLLVGASGGAWQQREKVQALAADYRTGTGEQLAITLADGGTLQLNTATTADVSYGSELREIRLYSGEIQVTTALDAQRRPFIVHTPQGSVRALGTRFLVRSDDGLTRVSVLEHAVEISPAQTFDQIRRVEAGQQLVFDSAKIEQAQLLSDNVNAWTRGLLIVSDWPLDHFLEELSRYHVGRLSWDKSVEKLRISGSFHLNDTHAVLANLAVTLPLDVRYFTRYWARIGGRE